MIKPSEIAIYDNLYAKPSLGGEHQRFSMAVLFKVKDSWIYSGQYCYQTNTWDILPSVCIEEKKTTGRGTFIDRDVEYWFYPPESIELFKKYRDDVLSGRCIDETSRLEEYSPLPTKMGTKRL